MPGGMTDRIAVAMQRLLQLGNSSARGRFATVAGAPLHYLEEGTGSPVVLLHGGAGGGANWFRLLRPLSARFRVLALDLPGFGLSPPREPLPPLGARAAALLDDWLAQVGVEDAIVVGTSFGGLAAARLALLAPARVRRLLLLDSAGLGRWVHPALRLATLPFLRAPTLRPTRRGTERTFRFLLTSNRSTLTSAMQDALIDYLYQTAASAGTAYMTQTLRHFAGPLGQREVLCREELQQLAQPTTIALGEHDHFFSHRAARRAAAAARSGVFQLIHGAGHSPNWEAPDAVSGAILALDER